MQVGDLNIKISADLSEYRKGLSDAQKQTQGFASTIKDTLKNAAGVALGMAGFQGIAATIKNTIGAGINLNAQLEQNQIAFQVLTGSAAQAKKIVQDLYKYSASTPFQFPGVAEAGRALQTVGLNVKETIKWVGDLAAANPQATIEEVARAIARLKSGDFGEAFERLRDFGISRKMLEGEGLVFDKSGSYKGSVEQALAAVENIVKNRYGGMAEAQSKTFTGMLSTLSDNLNMIFGTALEPVFNRIKQVLPEILDKLGKFSETFKNKGAAAAFKEIIPPGVVDALVTAGNIIKDIFGFIQAHGETVKAMLVGIGAGFAALKTIQTAVAAIKAFQSAIGLLPMLASPIGLVVIAVGLLAAAAYEIYTHWDGIKKFFSDTWKGIKDTVSNAANAVVDFLKKWGPLILAAITGPVGLIVFELAKHWDQIKQATLTAWNSIKTFLANIWNNIKTSVSNTFNDIKSSINNIWNSVKSGISNTVGNIYSRVVSGFENIWGYIKGIPSKAWGWGKNIISSIIDGFKSLHIPLPHFNFSIGRKNIAGISVPVPSASVKWYGEGGIFASPSIIGVGESGREAVVPIDRLVPLLSAALTKAASNRNSNRNLGDITVNINLHGNISIRSESDIKKLSQELANQTISALRGRGIVSTAGA